MIGDYPLDFPQGGVQTHFFHLSSHLSSNPDVEVNIITFGENDQCIRKNALTIHVIKRLVAVPRFLSILLDCWQLRREIHKINPDIVHIQATHYPYSLLASIICDEYPSVLTVHGLMAVEAKYTHFPHIIGAYISKFLERIAFSRIKHIIVVSPQIGDIIGKMTDANIHFVPNGVDINYINSIEPLSTDWKNTVLFIGNLIPLKGVDVLIRAMKIVKKQIPDVKLYIAGSGPQEDELKRLVSKLKLSQNVEFLGYLNDQSKYGYLKSIDIVVVPSLWETFSIVALEGMACEKPIIASNVGGIPYLIDNNTNGMLVDACDTVDLAKKICILLRDRVLRERMGKEGSSRSHAFNWGKVASDTISVYVSVINRRTRPY
jgi:glycosyltransferase involved in cell wall biosynthesis